MVRLFGVLAFESFNAVGPGAGPERNEETPRLGKVALDNMTRIACRVKRKDPLEPEKKGATFGCPNAHAFSSACRNVANKTLGKWRLG